MDYGEPLYRDKPGVISPEDLNLSSVTKRFVEKTGRSKRIALKVEKEYKRFLILTNTCDPVPPALVDDFWHLHILDTEKYENDCRLMDCFIHHTPDDGTGDLDGEFDSTIASYEKTFGEKPPKSIWR